MWATGNWRHTPVGPIDVSNGRQDTFTTGTIVSLKPRAHQDRALVLNRDVLSVAELAIHRGVQRHDLNRSLIPVRSNSGGIT